MSCLCLSNSIQPKSVLSTVVQQCQVIQSALSQQYPVLKRRKILHCFYNVNSYLSNVITCQQSCHWYDLWAGIIVLDLQPVDHMSVGELRGASMIKGWLCVPPWPASRVQPEATQSIHLETLFSYTVHKLLFCTNAEQHLNRNKNTTVWCESQSVWCEVPDFSSESVLTGQPARPLSSKSSSLEPEMKRC